MINDNLGTIENPVKCYGIQGEQDYLKNLAGPNGERIFFERKGSKMDNTLILDIYHLTSPDFQYDRTIYMNMYVKGYRERKALNGLVMKKSLLKPKPFQSIKYFNQLLVGVDKTMNGNYLYVWSKAGILLSTGPYIYSEFDALGQPKLDDADLEFIMKSAHQIVHDLGGLSPKQPLLLKDQAKLVDLMKIFHFDMLDQKEEGAFTFVHIITREKLVLFVKFI